MPEEPWLAPNETLKRRLAGGESQSFRLYLSKDDYAEVVVEQLGIDVRLEFLNPAGNRLATFDSPTGNQGPELAFMIAGVDGTYRLVVHSLYDSLAQGEYRVHFRKRRRATTRDKKNFRALLAHREAVDIMPACLQKALNLHRASLTYWEKTECPVGLIVSHSNIATLLSNSGDFDAALYHLREALKKWPDALRQCHIDNCVFANWLEPKKAAYIAIGRTYSQSGDHETALDYYQMALRSSNDNDSRFRTETLHMIGRAYLALSKPHLALAALEEAHKKWQKDAHFARQGTSLKVIARAHEVMGESEKAIAFYQNSTTLLEASHHTRRLIVSNLLNIGRIYLAMEKQTQAIDTNRRAFQTAHRLNSSAAKLDVLLAQGDLFLAIEQPKIAQSFYLQALDLAHCLNSPERQQHAHYGLAQQALALGHLDEARKSSEETLEIADRIWAQSLAPHLKRSILELQQPYFEFHIDLLMRLHATYPHHGLDRIAFETHERVRARSLFTLLSQGHHRVFANDSDQTEEEQNIRREIDDLHLQRSKRHQAGITIDQEQATAEENQLTDLLSRLHEIEAEARAKDPRWRTHHQPLPLELQDIQQILGSDTLLLKYALGEDRSVLWSITADHFESVELPPRLEIESAARRVYDLVSAPRRKPVFETKEQKQRRIKRAEADFYDAAVELSRLILEPLAGRLNRRRLVVVSDGVLQYIPFTVLPKPGSDPRSWVNDEFTPLVEDYEVVSAPSVAVLTHLLQKPQHRTASRTLAVVADPIFEADDPRLKPQGHAATLSANSSTQILESTRLVTRSADFLGRSGFSRLPGTREEALAILNLLPPGEGFAALDFEAQRRPELLNGLQDFQILHFATHAILNTKHPELSSIVLSLVDKQHQPLNGMLTLDDVSRLELDADLVVLSACQTALGKEVRGEGLIGLSSGFFQAGAATVVASLWSPQDEATAELMKRFYEAMFARDLAPSSALREAQLSMWREPRWRSPYYWGAFVVQGDWRALQELEHGAR